MLLIDHNYQQDVETSVLNNFENYGGFDAIE